jgi:hypothetical protein
MIMIMIALSAFHPDEDAKTSETSSGATNADIGRALI